MIESLLLPDKDYEYYKNCLKESDFLATEGRTILRDIEPFSDLLGQLEHLQGELNHHSFIELNFSVLKTWVCLDDEGDFENKYRPALFILLERLLSRWPDSLEKAEGIEEKLSLSRFFYLEDDKQVLLEQHYLRQPGQNNTPPKNFKPPIWKFDLKEVEAKFRQMWLDKIHIESRGIWHIHLVAKEEQLIKDLMVKRLVNTLEELSAVEYGFNENNIDMSLCEEMEAINISAQLMGRVMSSIANFTETMNEKLRYSLHERFKLDQPMYTIIPIHISGLRSKLNHDNLWMTFENFCNSQLNQLPPNEDSPTHHCIFFVFHVMKDNRHWDHFHLPFPREKDYKKQVAKDLPKVLAEYDNKDDIARWQRSLKGQKKYIHILELLKYDVGIRGIK